MTLKFFDEPFLKFDSWFCQAREKGVKEFNAMCLTTVDTNSQPSSRMVLLKYFDNNGFVFFTNLTSKKATDIASNNKVSLLFYWNVLGKQIRIQGEALKVTEAVSKVYFADRDRLSQIGAHASKQSQIMTNGRKELENQLNYYQNYFQGKEVSKPSYWSGYIVEPNMIEFWSEMPGRLHKRELYKIKHNKLWDFFILYP